MGRTGASVCSGEAATLVGWEPLSTPEADVHILKMTLKIKLSKTTSIKASAAQLSIDQALE